MTGKAATTTVPVEIQDPMQFSPKDVTIVVGQTVRWTWTGTDAHSTTSDTNVWDSGIQNGPGATFEFTFNDPGTYPYYCQLHGAPGGVGMSGTVTVKPA